MPFNRPTLTELVERNRADLDGRMPGADSRLRRSVLDVLGRVHAGGLHGVYGLLDHVWRQVFPDTAEAEELARWAVIWGVTRKAAAPAAGVVQLTGATGASCPAGTALLRADGVEYRTLAAVALVAGAGSVVVEAIVACGAGNATAGQRLGFVSPVAGVNATAIVAADGLSSGADEEDDEALRARLLDRIRQPPNGGSRSDYVRWALEVPGVTRAWVYPAELGPGTVTVRFAIDGRADIIPGAAEVAAVAAHLDELRPVTAAVTVVAPVAQPLAMTIRAVPGTVEVRAAIVASIADLLRREAQPGGTVLISHLREAVSIAAGETDHEIAVPAGNVTPPTGAIVVPGPITWLA